MRLTVNYTILDILHNEQMITAEKGISEEDLPFVKKIINKLVAYDCLFLTDDNGYFLRMYYDGFEDIENKILKVSLHKNNVNTIWEVKMSRARLYKLVKEALEHGLTEYVGICVGVWMKELFNGKDAYVIINYSNKTHLIRHNVTRAFEDDYKNGRFETKQITIFDTQPHHYYVDNHNGTIQISSVVFVSEQNNKTIVRYPYR